MNKLNEVIEMADIPDQPHIPTRFMIFSDTHRMNHVLDGFSRNYADVVLHCGDFTRKSKLNEFKYTIQSLQAMNAPLKLIIAGNHEFTMDIPAFRQRVKEANPPLGSGLVEETYGSDGEARRLFSEETGITFLDEGTHTFRLRNGALLKIYASPYTPSLGDGGFQYTPDRGHDFSIRNVDVVMTHGPPKGILDNSYSEAHAGCPFLFEAVARARPLMHCFGHIHEGWGGKFITWRPKMSPKPSHLTDIYNQDSHVIEKLSTPEGRIPWPALAATNHSSVNTQPQKTLKQGMQTLFINAAIKGRGDRPIQPPWLVDLDLPPAPYGIKCDFFGKVYPSSGKELNSCQTRGL
jgi:predicted MPP superfamily phosphohydrolase